MPFCPNCRDEFQDWVKVCPDCKVDLVEQLPSPPDTEKPYYIQTNLVTIASFPYPGEAYIMSSKLEAAGIWSFVADARIVNLNWMLCGAIGGVKLQVRENDAKEALEILQPKSESEIILCDEDRCPKCRSENIHYETFSLRPMYIVWLISYLFLGNGSYGGFILPFIKRKWRCGTCGYQWRYAD